MNHPAIGSLWRAGDGRHMRVTKIVESSHVPGGWWAELDVLPPYVKRQKRKSQANADRFSNGWLTAYNPEITQD